MQLGQFALYCTCVLSIVYRCGCTERGATGKSNAGKCISTRVCILRDLGSIANCAEEIFSPGNVSVISLTLSTGHCVHASGPAPDIGWFMDQPLQQWIRQCWNKKQCHVHVGTGARHVRVGVVMKGDWHHPIITPTACPIEMSPKGENVSRPFGVLDQDDDTHFCNVAYKHHDLSTTRWVIPAFAYNQFWKEVRRRRKRRQLRSRAWFSSVERKKRNSIRDEDLEESEPNVVGDIFSDTDDLLTEDINPDNDGDLPDSLDPVMTFPDDYITRISVSQEAVKGNPKTDSQQWQKQVNQRKKQEPSPAVAEEKAEAQQNRVMLMKLENDIENKLQSSLNSLMKTKDAQDTEEMSEVAGLALENKVANTLASVRKKVPGEVSEQTDIQAKQQAQPSASLMSPGGVNQKLTSDVDVQDSKHTPGADGGSGLPPVHRGSDGENTEDSDKEIVLLPKPASNSGDAYMHSPLHRSSNLTTADASTTTTTTTTSTITNSTTSVGTTQTPASTTNISKVTNISENVSKTAPNSIGQINSTKTPTAAAPSRTLAAELSSVKIRSGQAQLGPTSVTVDIKTLQKNFRRAEEEFKTSFGQLKKKMRRIVHGQHNPKRRNMLQHLERTVWKSTHAVAWAMAKEICEEPLRRLALGDSSWQDWTPWSPCTLTCGSKGYSVRWRACKPHHVCEGSKQDMRECGNQAKCLGTAKWLGWSVWSRCSVTCGEGGVKYRTRSCLTSDSSQNCQGQSTDIMKCGHRPCFLIGLQGKPMQTHQSPRSKVKKPPHPLAPPTTRPPEPKRRRRKKDPAERQSTKHHKGKKRSHSLSEPVITEGAMLVDSALDDMQGLEEYKARQRKTESTLKHHHGEGENLLRAGGAHAGPASQGQDGARVYSRLPFQSKDYSSVNNERLPPSKDALPAFYEPSAQGKDDLQMMVRHKSEKERLLHFAWSAWGMWSPCSVSCGKGTQFRRRECMKRIGDSFEGETVAAGRCSGPNKERMYCAEGSCPPSIAIPFSLVHVSRAGEGKLRCMHSYKGEASGLYWITPSGERVSEATKSKKYQMQNLTLIIHNTTLSDLGQYLCVLVDPKSSDAMLKAANSSLPPASSWSFASAGEKECEEMPCENGGTCHSTRHLWPAEPGAPRHYECICKEGFYGNHCEQESIMEAHKPHLRIMGYVLLGLIGVLIIVSTCMFVCHLLEKNKAQVDLRPVMTRRRSEDEWRKMKSFDNKVKSPKSISPARFTKRLSEIWASSKKDDSDPRKASMFGIEPSPDLPSLRQGQKPTVSEEVFKQFSNKPSSGSVRHLPKPGRQVKLWQEDNSQNASPPPTLANTAHHQPSFCVNPTIIYSDDKMEIFTSSNASPSPEHHRFNPSLCLHEETVGDDQTSRARSRQCTTANNMYQDFIQPVRGMKLKEKQRAKKRQVMHRSMKYGFNQNNSDESNEGSAEPIPCQAGSHTRSRQPASGPGITFPSGATPREGEHNSVCHYSSTESGEEAEPGQLSSAGSGARPKVRTASHQHQGKRSSSRKSSRNPPGCEASHTVHEDQERNDSWLRSNGFRDRGHDQKVYEVHHPDEPYPYRLSRSRRKLRDTKEEPDAGRPTVNRLVRPDPTERSSRHQTRNQTVAEGSTSSTSQHLRRPVCSPQQFKHLEGGGEGAAAAVRSEARKSGRDLLLRRAMENSFIRATAGMEARYTPLPSVESAVDTTSPFNHCSSPQASSQQEDRRQKRDIMQQQQEGGAGSRSDCGERQQWSQSGSASGSNTTSPQGYHNNTPPTHKMPSRSGLQATQRHDSSWLLGDSKIFPGFSWQPRTKEHVSTPCKREMFSCANTDLSVEQQSLTHSSRVHHDSKTPGVSGGTPLGYQQQSCSNSPCTSQEKQALKSAMKHASLPQPICSHMEKKPPPRRVSFSELQVREGQCLDNDPDLAWGDDMQTTNTQFDAIMQRFGGPLATERQFEDISRRPCGPLDLDSFSTALPGVNCLPERAEKRGRRSSFASVVGDSSSLFTSHAKSLWHSGFLRPNSDEVQSAMSEQCEKTHSTASFPQAEPHTSSDRETLPAELMMPLKTLTVTSSAPSSPMTASSPSCANRTMENTLDISQAGQPPLLVDLEPQHSQDDPPQRVAREEETTSTQLLRPGLPLPLSSSPAWTWPDPAGQQSDHFQSPNNCEEACHAAQPAEVDNSTSSQYSSAHSLTNRPMSLDTFQEILAVRTPGAFFKPIDRE